MNDAEPTSRSSQDRTGPSYGHFLLVTEEQTRHTRYAANNKNQYDINKLLSNILAPQRGEYIAPTLSRRVSYLTRLFIRSAMSPYPGTPRYNRRCSIRPGFLHPRQTYIGFEFQEH